MSKRALKTYGVTVPICGKAYVEVQATDEADAIDKALGKITAADLEEWESLAHVVTGNVFHGQLNEAHAELIDDE